MFKKTFSESNKNSRNWVSNCIPWLANHPRTVLGILLLLCLGPVLNKPIRTDDALFVWAAEWIKQHPFDFYGSSVNWWVSDVPMWVANWNPPLFSYYLAVVATFLGGTETMLHLGCYGVSAVACLGMYSFAQKWCRRPLLATIVAMFTPAFLVSSSTLMCDVLMLAFWIWAMVLWEEVLTGGEGRWRLVAVGILAGLAILTKYSAVMLLPLLAFIALLRTRKLGSWILGLAISGVMVIAYEMLTAEMYGKGLISAASYHAQTFRPSFSGGATAIGLVGLAFIGGSLLPLTFFAPWVWRKRVLLVAGIMLMVGWYLSYQYWERMGLQTAGSAALVKHWEFVFEFVLLVLSGIQFVVLVTSEVWHRRNTDSIILFVWIFGVLFFATVVNWIINVRSFLPLVPAAAILLVRRLETVPDSGGHLARWWTAMGLTSVAGFSLLFADYQAALSDKNSVSKIMEKYKPAGHQLWFSGHGSFQFYMQKLGGLPIDTSSTRLLPGDIVVMPQLGYGLRTLPLGSVGWMQYLLSKPSGWMNLTGNSTRSAAGFYCAIDGPVPFAVGEFPGQCFFILKVFAPVQFDSRAVNLKGKAIDDVPSFPKISCVVETPIRFSSKPEAAAEIKRAITNEQAGQFEQAIKNYRHAVAMDPENPESLSRLAWLLATTKPELRRGDEAVQLATKAVELTTSRLPVVMETLGAAYAQNGDFPQAIRWSKIAGSLAVLTGQENIANDTAALLANYTAGKPAPTPAESQYASEKWPELGN